LLICDVDEFKSINDHFGHQYGDDCLKAVAEAILDALHRPADMPARYGGDEFVVILPETNALGAELLGIKICEHINELALIQAPDAKHDHVSLSIGCSTLIPTTDNSIEQLFSLADKNLFKAKEKGRNCVVADTEFK
jgi:diguanylate cyclase (GGDEF)-like protein